MTPNWLNDTAMNLLVDYYTEVPFRPYGSGCTKANTLPWLKQLDLGYVCVYAKGHGGFTTWRSSLGTAHGKLAQDMPRFFREVTRAAGTKLVLYYSGLLDGVAGERHPDWRMHDLDGKPKAFFQDFQFIKAHAMCPQSGYFEEWVAVHLRELIGAYDPDGIWVDGDWPGPCYCPRCQKRFRHDTGWTGSWATLKQRPDFAAAYARTWAQIEHAWRTRFRNLVKALKPDCVYSAGNVSPRREFLAPFDWRSGDFFSPNFFFLHDIARMMRWYGTLGVPYDAYVCDTSFTHGRLNVRSRTKALDRMLQEAATVASNGGAVGYWTFPLGNGALVPSRMQKAVAVREFLAARHDVLVNTEPVPVTAIVVSDPATPTFGGANVEGAHKALAALHRSPSVLDETGVQAQMPYDLVVLPEQAQLDAATAKSLAAFVRRGGKLLTTGATIQSRELRRLLGVRRVTRGALQDGHVILAPGGEPTGVGSAWDKLVLAGARELYPLYRSWDPFNPDAGTITNNWPMHGQLDEEHPELAGMPAAVTRRVGRGTVVHIATDIFGQYQKLGDPQLLRWLREMLGFLDPRPRLRTTAPSWVDVSLRRQGERVLVHFVNQNPGRDVAKLGSDDLWVDEIPTVGPFTLTLRLPRRPSRVMWRPAGRRVAFGWKRGELTLTVPRFQIHGCIALA